MPRASGPPSFTNPKLKIKDSTFLLSLHLPLGDAAGAGLAAALAGAFQLQLARAGGAVESVVQLLAERTSRQIAVNLALTLAMAAHHNAAGHMGEVDAIIRLVDFLAALAAASHKLLLEVILVYSQALHHLLQLLHFLRRNRHIFLIIVFYDTDDKMWALSETPPAYIPH